MGWLNTTLRLSSDAKSIQTKTGTPMCTAFGFMDVNADNGYPLSVVAFGDLASELAKMKKGSTVAVTGKLQLNTYQNKNGEPVEQLQVLVDGISTVKRRSPVFNHYDKKPEKATQSFYDDSLESI